MLVVRDTEQEMAVIAAVCKFCFFKVFSCTAHLLWVAWYYVQE